MFGGLLLIIGAILLIVALLVSWYTISISFSTSESIAGSTVTGSGTDHVDLHPGSMYAYSSSSSYTCTGAAAPYCPASQSTSGSCPYGGSSNSSSCSSLDEKATGNLYSATQFLVIGALALGFIAGILALMAGGRPGMRKGAMALGIIALLLALVTPITLFAAQPGAVKSDYTPSGGQAPSGSGPWSSYIGSCSGSSCGMGSGSGNGTESWGPSTGWYLSLGAFVVFLLGILMVRGGRDDASTSAASSPAAAPAMGSDSSMGVSPPAAPPPSGPP
jgi:hypothetical protein